MIVHGVEQETMSESEATQLMSSLTRSQIMRILTAPRSDPLNQVPATNFATYMRFHLNIPQPLLWGMPVARPGTDMELEMCMNHHEETEYLDGGGNHAANCTSAHGGRWCLHSFFNKVFLKTPRLVQGLTADREPATAGLPRGRFSTEECRRLFPKKMNKQTKAAAEEYAKILELLPRADADEVVVLRERLETLAQQVGSKTKGLRLDVALEHDSGHMALVDGSCVHTTAGAREGPAFSFLKNQVTAKITNQGENSTMTPPWFKRKRRSTRSMHH